MLLSLLPNYNVCDFCDVQFYSVKSLLKHKERYCHKRRKLQRSCTITSETSSVSPESKSPELIKAGKLHKNTPLPTARGNVPMLCVRVSPFAKNWNEDASLEGSFCTTVEIDYSKYLHEDQLWDVTNSDYTQRWPGQQFNHSAESPERKKRNSLPQTNRGNVSTPLVTGVPFTENCNAGMAQPEENHNVGRFPFIEVKNNSTFTQECIDQQLRNAGQLPPINTVIPRGNVSTPLVPGEPFAENRNADASLEGSFYPAEETNRSKYLHKDITNSDYTQRWLDQQFNYSGESPKMKRCDNSSLLTPRGNASTSVVPGLPFADNCNADPSLERLFHPSVGMDHSKHLHKDGVLEDVTNSDYAHQQINYTRKFRKRKKSNSSLRPTPRCNDSTSLVPGLPFADNWNEDAPLEGTGLSYCPPQKREQEMNDEVAKLNSLVGKLQQYLNNQ